MTVSRIEWARMRFEVWLLHRAALFFERWDQACGARGRPRRCYACWRPF